jgi:hypothetical protein
MNLRVILIGFVMILLTISSVIAPSHEVESQSSEEIDWDNPNDIRIDNLIKDPDSAIENWDKLPDNKKEKLYLQDGALGDPQFAQKFSEEKGLTGADFSNGDVEYDGTSIKNGELKLDLNELQGAQVASLPDGGFDITFSGSKEISQYDFSQDIPEMGIIGGPIGTTIIQSTGTTAIRLYEDGSIKLPIGSSMSSAIGPIIAKGDVTVFNTDDSFVVIGHAGLLKGENREGTFMIRNDGTKIQADNAHIKIDNLYEFDGKFEFDNKPGDLLPNPMKVMLHPIGDEDSTFTDLTGKDDLVFTTKGKDFEVINEVFNKRNLYAPQDPTKATAHYERRTDNTKLTIKGEGKFEGLGFNYEGEHDSAALNGVSYPDSAFNKERKLVNHNYFGVYSSFGVFNSEGNVVDNDFQGSLATTRKVLGNGQEITINYNQNAKREITSKIGDMTSLGETSKEASNFVDSFTTTEEHLMVKGDKMFQLSDSKFHKMDFSDGAIDRQLDIHSQMGNARVEQEKTTFGTRKKYFDPLTGDLLNVRVTDEETGEVTDVDPEYVSEMDLYVENLKREPLTTKSRISDPLGDYQEEVPGTDDGDREGIKGSDGSERIKEAQLSFFERMALDSGTSIDEIIELRAARKRAIESLEKTGSGHLNEFEKDHLIDTQQARDHVRHGHSHVGSASEEVDAINFNLENVGEQILDKYFAPEARERLKDVKLTKVDSLSSSLTSTGSAAGIAFPGGILGLLALNGWTPEIKYVDKGSDAWKSELLVHEYLHQADFKDLIDDNEFDNAFERMRNDPQYNGLITHVENRADYDYKWYDKLSMGLIGMTNTEKMAYMSAYVALKPSEVPDYMKEVYKNVLKAASE